MRDYNAAMRHKDVHLCTMGALAQYLFWRWHIVGEDPPDFSSHKSWYELKILVGANRFKPLSYETQADCCAAALAEAGIIADLVTHVCRGSSAKRAELLGVPESEVSALNLLYYAIYTIHY
jgi:Centromere DNA-binding protein complex CBF3 subunit, domain 2